MKMIIPIRALQPNPLRDFIVDPIDRDDDPITGYISAVSKLRDSITQDGFWGGVVVRETAPGAYQIACGHHRIEAALAAGMTHADVVVLPLDDAGMVRVYAIENATQRGAGSHALAGTVAAAVRYLAKSILAGGVSAKICRHSDDIVLGQVQSDKGIGESLVTAQLAGVPSINRSVVKEQLANLKSSGNYARIIGEVQADIEREYKDALQAAEEARRLEQQAEHRRIAAEHAADMARERERDARDEAARARAERERQEAEARARAQTKIREDLKEEAKQFAPRVATAKAAVVVATKAAEKAAERDVTFDYEGVSKHLRNDNQVRAFRTWATGQGIVPYLPVSSQADLARALVEYAHQHDQELSAAFINREASNLLLHAKTTFAKEHREAVERKSLDDKTRQWMDEFARSCRGMIRAGIEIAALSKKWPKGVPFPITAGFLSALAEANSVIAQLQKEINHE